MGLKIADCLGPNFDAKVLEIAKSDDDLDVKSFLNLVLKVVFSKPSPLTIMFGLMIKW